jgi:hypothetical protein
MFATNIDAETTDEKVQALLDYLNEENGTKLKKEILRLKNSRIQNQVLYIILHLVHIMYLQIQKAMMQLIRELMIYGMI